MSVEQVEELGAEVEASWRAGNYAPHMLPSLATSALETARLPERLRAEDVVRWVFRGRELPQQPDPAAKFGQPPVTLFRGRRIYVDALFWVDGTTTIHQHGFSGAFQVLSGSSIETRYSFNSERSVDGRFAIGTLNVESTRFLRPPDVRPIESGGRLIHSLFHLERPSMTIVVRTYNDPESGPQFDHALPGVAHDPFYTDVARDRALQLVGMLRAIEHPDLEQLVGDLVSSSDLHTAYRVLRECSTLPDVELFGRLINRVRDPVAAERFRLVFEERRRIAFLKSRRNLVKEPDLRFFLGVLLNAHRRQDVLALVNQRNSDEQPGRQVAAWLARLSKVTMKLQAGGIPWQPNLLGLPDFTDELQGAVARFLDGRDAAEEGVSAFVAKLRAIPALASLFS